MWGGQSPLYFCRAAHDLRWRQYLPKTRRAEPHRRAQDQQLHWPGIAGPAVGKKRIIAETGAGMHGVATATVAARFGLPCVIYMGSTDIERQQPNVFRMKLLGAEVIPVTSGTGTLKDAMNEALRDWVTNSDDTFYIIGTVAGPHPYPAMVRDFQAVIGHETRAQMLEKKGRLPDSLVACIGGGSNAMGLFHPFLNNLDVKMIGVEAAAKAFKAAYTRPA